jgi:hypothetical protein
VNHPGLFVTGVALMAVALAIAVATVWILRPGLREESPVWALGCAGPAAALSALLTALLGAYFVMGAFSDNLGR